MSNYTELVKALREEAEAPFPTESWDSKLLLDAADAIEGLSHALDQIKEWRKNQWISVEERLPEDNGDYLVFVTNPKTEYRGIEIVGYDSGFEMFGTYFEYADPYTLAVERSFNPVEGVSFWMLLPAPPKEEA